MQQHARSKQFVCEQTASAPHRRMQMLCSQLVPRASLDHRRNVRPLAVGGTVPQTMRAIQAFGPKDYRMNEQTPVPVPKEGEILVRVAAVGICGSDVKMWKGGEFYWGPNGRVRKQLPVIPGHEFVGHVVALGAGSDKKYNVSMGDMVVAEQMLFCRQCWFCTHDHINKCDNLRIYGQGFDGAMAEYMIYSKEGTIHKVPSGLSPLDAVMAEPFAVSIHAVDIACPKAHDTIAVCGAGMMGLGVIAGLRFYYPKCRIIALDKHKFKLRVAKLAGADETILVNGDTADAVKQLLALTESRGCDIYVEASGNPDSVAQGLQGTRKKGKFVHLGIFPNGIVPTEWNAISAGKELSIHGVSLGVGCWDRAFEIIGSGALPVKEIITHHLPLTEFERGFANTLDPKECIKVVLDPNLSHGQGTVHLPPAHELEERKEPRSVEERSLTTLAHSSGNASFSASSSLKGKVAWVTGSSRGIGLAIAEKLSSLGASVVLHGTHAKSPSTFKKEGGTMQELAGRLQDATKNPTLAVVGDLTSREESKRMVQEIEKKLGAVDILVCCAGGNIGATGASTETGGMPVADDCLTVSETDVKSVIDRNLTTAINACAVVAPTMAQRKAGRVIVIGSIAGTVGRAQGAMYAVAKAATHEYARCLAVQMRPHNVPVNVIAPGATLTDRYVRNLNHQLDPSKTPQDNTTNQPQLERYGLPADTANAVALLCSPDASFVSGQVIRVDGGVQTFAC